MSVKMYNEDYINETAKAIQKLTGRTEKMKVSEFADVINTYIEPNDLTNVHQVKITITEVNPGYSFTLNGIHFFNNVSEEEYVYGSLDTVSVTGVTSISKDINNIKWKSDVVFYSYTLPVTLTISFPAGIDLTYFNELQIRGGCNGNYQAPIKTMNMDVRSGTSDYFTRIISEAHPKYVFAQGTYNNGYNRMVLDIGHKNYRYCCFEILHIQGNDSATTSSTTYSGGLAFYDSDNTKFIPNNMASVSTGSYHDDLSDFLTETNTTTYEVCGNGNPSSTDTGTVKLIIDFYNTPLDINEYGKCIYYQPPNNWWTTNDVNLIFTNDKYFISTGFKRYVECNHDVTGQYFSKQLV